MSRRNRQGENGILIYNSESPLSCANPFVTRVCLKNTRTWKTSAEYGIKSCYTQFSSANSIVTSNCPNTSASWLTVSSAASVFVADLADERYGFVRMGDGQDCLWVRRQARDWGGLRMARATATRCCCPTDNCEGRYFIRFASPNPLKQMLGELGINALTKHHAEHHIF